MASIIKVKRRNADNTAPTTGDLAEGEIAVNTVSQKLYIRDDNDTILSVGLQDGTADGNALIWDSGTETWVETTLINVDDTGKISINATNGLVVTGLATSDPAVAGQLWNDSGTMKVSAG